MTLPAILQVLPSLVSGGVERGTLEIAEAIVGAGGRALVASAGGPLADRLEALGAHHVTLPLRTKSPAGILRNAGALARLVAAERVGIIHARSRGPAWSGWLAARRTGVHFVTTYHGTYNEGFPGKRLYNSVMARGERVIAVSRFIAAHLRDRHGTDPSRIRIIPRGVDPRRFDPAAVAPERVVGLRAAWGLPEGRAVVMLPGRLTRWKGQAVLVEAMAKLGGDSVAVLVGDGGTAYRQELVARAAALGLQDRLLLAGHVDDMAAALLLADVVVHASTDAEAFGRTVIEAQAMGRPVIAADLGGPRETVEEGVTGWRVPPGDAAALAAAIGTALAMGYEGRAAIGRAARAHVLAHYSTRAMQDATLAVYRGIALTMAKERILVIKLAALGDFVQAFGPFAAIRAKHPEAEIILLTTPPYAGLARRSPWFDAVWEDGRPRWTNLPAVWTLARRLRGAGFTRVYDLQTSSRSSRYRRFVGPGAEWSGIARGASHPHANPGRDLMHTAERQREQLEMAGITDFPPPTLDWLDDDIGAFGLPPRFALLVPGASPGRGGKRWPVECFADLAGGLNLPVVVVGGKAEAPLAATIGAAVPGRCIDLTGRTSLIALGAVARRAAFAIGNDTGPTHLIAAAGCPTLALFGAESDPALCAPRGRSVAVLRHARLAALEVAQVRAALAALVAA